MSAVRKMNSLLSSGTVTVTGPTQTRIIKQQRQPQPKTVFVQKGECYVCDEHIGNNGTLVTEAFTTASNTKIPTKIGRIVGDAFMVIVSVDDVICKRCLSMFNEMDRLETDLDHVKTNILTLINKKYGINDNGNASSSSNTSVSDLKPPPVKVQRLNTSAGSMNSSFTSNRKTSNGGSADDDATKLTAVPLVQSIPQQINQFTSQTRLVAVGDGDIAMYDPTQPNNFGQTQLVRQVNATPMQQQAAPVQQKKPIKIYKCMSCDFKTTDIKLFQPHYEACRQQNGYRCKICKKIFPNVATLKAHNVEKHANEFTCTACNMNCINEATYKKHMETHHPESKTLEAPTNIVAGTLYACSQCNYKSYDKSTFDVHARKHVKAKPFKCRICSARFEKREQANLHAKIHCPDYFKCGTCSMTFTQKDLLMKHFETHQQKPTHIVQKQQVVAQQQIQQQGQTQIVSQDLTTQKLLQDTIDEALRESGDGRPHINFYSCHLCSLTFVQDNYYKNHMEEHKRKNNKKPGTPTATATVSNANSLIRSDQRSTNAQAAIVQTQQNTNMSDSDLEIMFEKMHSDKAEIEGNSNNSENLVITSQESSTGYTFNITMGNQQEASANNIDMESKIKQEENEALTQVSIDMPRLDQSEEQLQTAQQQQHQQEEHQQQEVTEQIATDEADEQQQQEQEQQEKEQDGEAHPVSMPSLDDESQQSSDQVPMDLDDIQNAAESGQIKFILNENGQLLHLENHHILTTDADGNQILVQDSEQIQQLLQSVGVLQAGDGEGGEQTFQMIQGENNQMILVHGENNEAQLIDASMLNEDGELVLQHHDGELPQGVHIVNEEELNQHTEGLVNEEMQHVAHHEQEVQHQHNEHLEGEQTVLIKSEQDAEHLQQVVNESDITTVTTSTRTPVTSTAGGEMYLCLEEIIGQPEQK